METTAASNAFNVLDDKYQVDPAFPPDKESTWIHPKERDGWTHAHNSLRGEVNQMKDALEQVSKRGAVPEWAIASIKAWWMGHLGHIHAHHKNEDDIVGPFVRTRFHWPEKLKPITSKS